MRNYEEIENITFINKTSVIKTCLISILFYVILNLIFIKNFFMLILTIRIYYIVASITFSILLKPISRIYNECIIKVIYIFSYLNTVIYIMVFITNTKMIPVLNIYNTYVDISTNTFILMGEFIVYIIIGYKVKKEKKDNTLYTILAIIFCVSLFCYYKQLILNQTLVIIFFIEGLSLINFFANKIRKRNIINIKKDNLNIINIYLCLVILIFILSIIYNFYQYKYNLISLMELLIFVQFNIIWKFFATNLIKNPYKNLYESLIKKIKNVNYLSRELLVKNKQLETSINNLRNKQYLYTTFFRFMPHPMILLNLQNDRILFVNKPFLDLVNISTRREVINKKLYEYITFIDEDKINNNYNAILNTRDQDKFINVQFLSAYKDRMQEIILIEDNTSKVLTEEIKKQVQNKIIEESIRTEFLSGISHDLKTPINVIYSATQLESIYMEKTDVQALKKYSNISKKNCISLIRLTNNLIDSSKINSGYLIPRLEKLNVVEVVEDVVTSLVDYSKSNYTELIFNTNTEECYFNLDYEFMQRIILNLISNSIKFTSHKGRIDVNIEYENNCVNISVKDNGFGINKEFIKEAFTKYSTDEKAAYSKKETGIGLFVVKKLVELQHGNIDVQTELGVGTNIIIQFKRESLNEYE
ncbi:sensor histidine kinase [Clostridium uliginosum]|uniref:histidine kinase n=1 Tax=Clostridium uliginosum TaxID=119641 RepID=A0A1I1S0J2_9CLOT|nr:HAMP domain-containing sensor histidine kinase [Clostridium uliginosum]SFD38068.1 Signal transduction histidine kinase [Clostridium uliginosum]